MTETVFRRQTVAAFARSPIVPVVLELDSGDRVLVDVPEQLSPGRAAVDVSRPGQSDLRIDYERVDRVVSLDQLPADAGGLSYADFYAAVRPLLWADPYRPFALELRDGTTLAIDRPGRLALAGRFGVFLPPEPAGYVRFTYDQVSRVLAPAPDGKAGHAA